MWSRILTKEEKFIYSSFYLDKDHSVKVKNHLIDKLEAELDSVLVAAKLLEYDCLLGYAKSGVVFTFGFHRQGKTETISFNGLSFPIYKNPDFNLTFSCQNSIRELDYVTFDYRDIEKNHMDSYTGYREDYNGIQNKLCENGDLWMPFQRMKEHM